MSKIVGGELNAALLSRLSLARAIEQADHAIVICTVGDDGRPHPAMLSSLEVVAKDTRHIRLTMHGASRSARNLRANGQLTLIVVDQSGVFYIKGDVELLSPAMAAAPDQAKFNMRVDSVLEDNPTLYEHARVTSGICVERGDLDLVHARAVLTELITDH
jgi:hypothetical protein